jgi:hypothetical protein
VAHGDYRTKRVILEISDALAESIRIGQPYQTRLDPPPADPRCCHPPRVVGGRAASVSARPRLVALEAARVFRNVRPRREDRHRTCVPRIDLEAAAGSFSEEQVPGFAGWVEVNASRTLKKGMFVAQVVGQSMEPLIPNGSYCLFQRKVPQPRPDIVALIQLHGNPDAESGGRFTVKRLRVSTRWTADEMQRTVTLVPENPAFESITVEDENVTMVAEFVEVLGPLENLGSDSED